MLVKDIMTRHPIMISASTAAPEAQKIMSENGIRHLPVVGDGKILEGLITQQSLKLDPETMGSLNVWEITRYLSTLLVKNVMVTADKVYTISPDKTTERAARIMIDQRIGCLPVVEDGNVVVGILSKVDLLVAFQEMLALPSDGVRITVRMPNTKGQFAKLVTVLGDEDIGVMGIGTYPTPRQEEFYDAVLKIRNVPLERVKNIFSQINGWDVIDIRDVV